jgi:ABC-type Fe3+-hydroxamate transport system substrate-binding protein
MFIHVDQLGNTTRLNKKPKRIISIVPSQSEFLWDIGIREELIGITKFCIHPADMHKIVTRVGGTKDLNIEKIRALNPDLIIGNKEENEKQQIEQLQKEFNVWMSDIYNFEDAFEMMALLGNMMDKDNEAQKIIEDIKKSTTTIKNFFDKKRVAYFIWNKPYMLAAKNTFIDYVLNYIGFENALSHLERYPELSVESLQDINPEVCFLSSEPFPFKEKHVIELQEKLPASKILIVDGEVFSWYGSRLLRLESYIRELKDKVYRNNLAT